ncbi:hypothetical protein AAFN75_01810 [Algibacter sp. AS12]|uniref:hypothetical protein n=1 Tax=Algibacter sp. AS12 TaxID=3135773 RepID=UPI00398B31CD
MYIIRLTSFFLFLLFLGSCTDDIVVLTNGIDESAGGGSAYIITTNAATYYLEKEGGGLSSMLDKDGVDWIAFHKEKGSAHKGEYRGFPNAIHKQDGSYFHAMNAGTTPSTSEVEIVTDEHVRITFTSDNKQWEGQWDFFNDRCDFTMRKVSPGYNYWVLYEGVPGGEMDTSDFWFASSDTKQHAIEEPFQGDLPAPEWMAFGDQKSPRVLYMLHHKNDELSDNYVGRNDMTVFGFGRKNGKKTTKHLNSVQTFSIGFIESKDYNEVEETVKKILQ